MKSTETKEQSKSIMRALLGHLSSQVEFAHEPKSAFLDNAAEDVQNILLITAVIAPSQNEIASELYKQVKELKTSKNFNFYRKDLLSEIADFKKQGSLA